MLNRMSTNKTYTLLQILDMDGQLFNIFHLAKSKKLPFNPSNYTKSASGTINYTLVQLVEDLLQKPDDFEIGFFIECDLEFPQDIKEKSENFPLCFYQVEANCELFSEYMNFIEQPNHKPTLKLVCDLTNKHI